MEIFSLDSIMPLIGIFFLSIVTTVSGIGGGGIFIPYLMFTLNFTLLEAVPLAITIILSDCLIRIMLLYKMPSVEKPSRYLMDLTPANIIVPFDGMFSWAGVFLLKALPSVLTIIVVILLTLISLYKIINTTIKECRKQRIEEHTLEIDGIEIYLKNNNNNNNLQMIEDRYWNLFLVIITVGLIAIFGLRESFKICSLEFWLMICGNIVSMIILSFVSGYYILSQYNYRKVTNFPFTTSDISWNTCNIVSLGFLSSISGVLSTWLGLGGSSIITPILYYYEMKPEVVGVSIGVSTLFSSLISLLNFMFSGNYLYNWGLTLFLVSFIGSLIGIFLLKVFIKYFNKGIISGLVTVVMTLSVISLILNLIFSDNGITLNINNPC